VLNKHVESLNVLMLGTPLKPADWLIYIAQLVVGHYALHFALIVN
jgi:hypothetical protein